MLSVLIGLLIIRQLFFAFFFILLMLSVLIGLLIIRQLFLVFFLVSLELLLVHRFFVFTKSLPHLPCNLQHLLVSHLRVFPFYLGPVVAEPEEVGGLGPLGGVRVLDNLLLAPTL